MGGKRLPVVGMDHNYYRKILFVVETGLRVRIEESGLRHNNGRAVKNKWSKDVAQGGVIVRVGPDGDTIKSEL